MVEQANAWNASYGLNHCGDDVGTASFAHIRHAFDEHADGQDIRDAMTVLYFRDRLCYTGRRFSCQKRIDTRSVTLTMRRLLSIATPRSSSFCSSVSITTSRPATSSLSTSGRERCSSIAVIR